MQDLRRQGLAVAVLAGLLATAGCGGAGQGAVGTGQAAQPTNTGVMAPALQGKWKGTERSVSMELDVAAPSGNVFTAKLTYKNTETGAMAIYDIGAIYDAGERTFQVTTSNLNSASNAGQIDDRALLGSQGSLIQNGQFMVFQIPNFPTFVLTKG